MSDDPDGISTLHLTRIPKWMLIITVIDFALWCSVLPLVLGLRQGVGEWLQLAAIGLFAIPAMVMVLFIGRLIYYFITQFYWYLIGLSSLIGIFWGGATLVAALSQPARAPFNIDPHAALNLVPADLRTFAGALLVVLAIAGVFMIGRWTARKPKAVKPETVTPALNPPSPILQFGAEEQRIREQLRKRAQGNSQTRKP